MTETVLNDRVTHGLRAQFNQARVDAILSQAETMFQESAYRSGNKEPTPAEPYELFESGWIDRALEFLGFGRWAIGRPKQLPSVEPLSRGSQPRLARHVARSSLRIEPVAQSVVSLFEAHLPRSIEGLRFPQNPWENAIEYHNLLIIGEQGSGKTTLARTLALALKQRYGDSSTFCGIQVGGLGALLEYGTRVHGSVWFLVGEDLTLSRIPRQFVSAFFQVRSLIMARTGLNRGLVVTAFNSHTLFGIERNLRTTFNMLILKSIPANPYDRGLLKRYFDATLLDWLEAHGSIEDALVWDRFHPHGIIAKVSLPSTNALTEIVATGNATGFKWWWGLLFPLVYLTAIAGILLGWW